MELTDQIQISVNTEYLENQSLPSNNRFVFSYTVTITNTSEYPVVKVLLENNL